MKKEDHIYSYYEFVYKCYQVVLQTKWMWYECENINIHFRSLIEINDDFISHTAEIEINKFVSYYTKKLNLYIINRNRNRKNKKKYYKINLNL